MEDDSVLLLKEIDNALEKYALAFDIIYPYEYLTDKKYLKAFMLRLGKAVFKIYVDDEYDDLKLNNKYLNYYLFISSIEVFIDCENFEAWAKEMMLEENDASAKAYYDKFKAFYEKRVKDKLIIEPYLSSFEYELNAGIFQQLRLK